MDLYNLRRIAVERAVQLAADPRLRDAARRVVDVGAAALDEARRVAIDARAMAQAAATRDVPVDDDTRDLKAQLDAIRARASTVRPAGEAR